MVIQSDIAIRKILGLFLDKVERTKELALLSIKRHIEGSMKRYEALKKTEI